MESLQCSTIAVKKDAFGSFGIFYRNHLPFGIPLKIAVIIDNVCYVFNLLFSVR